MKPTFPTSLVPLAALCAWSLSACAAAGRVEPRAQEAVTSLDGPASEAERPLGGRVSLVLAGRGMDDDDYWKPTEDHFAVGIDLAAPLAEAFDWAFGLSFSAGHESKSGIEYQSSLGEVYGGVDWNPLREGKVHPYVGLGLSGVSVRVEASDDFQGGHVSTWDDDGTFGIYGRAGVLWQVGEAWGLGLEYRLLRGTDVELFREDGDADYDQIGVVVSLGV